MTTHEIRTAAEQMIGKTVRSFDFANGPADDPYGRDLEGERACYIVGTVVGILKADDFASDGKTTFHDCDRYILKADHRIFRGEIEIAKVKNQEFFPPLNGTNAIHNEISMVEEVV